MATAGLRVTDVEALILRQGTVDASRADGGQDSLLVKIHTDGGLVGIGEVDSSPELAAAAILAPASNAVTQGLRSLLLGLDPTDTESAWQRLYRGSMYMGRRGAVIHALSGVDMALWDLHGKATGQPVNALMGTLRNPMVRVYASVLMDEDELSVRERVIDLRTRGFTAIKLGWGPLGASVTRDVELATAAREAAGNDVDLMLDAGCGYRNSVRDALYVATALEELGYRWLEEPLLPDDLDAYAALTAASPVPIAFGEQNTTYWEFREIARARAAHIIQPDLARCGGITEGLRIARLAHENDLSCVPHAWKSGILKAASLHLNSILPGERLQEWSVTENVLSSTLVSTEMPVIDGAVAVPVGPGLGVEVNDAVARSFLVDQGR